MILLTGASGYLGQHVVQRLADNHVSWVVGGPRSESGIDLTDFGAVQRMMNDVRPDVVIHCASEVPKLPQDYDRADSAVNNLLMLQNIIDATRAQIVLASSIVAKDPRSSRYATSKYASEQVLLCQRQNSAIMRLPGLFGLPRRSGVIYESAVRGERREYYGPNPAMHVEDAAEYLVRAATMRGDGNAQPYSVTYDDCRLESVYGSVGVTFEWRVHQFINELMAH